MIPRKDRPLPEDLEGYVRRSEPEPDYALYRTEQADYLADYRREEEEKREREASGRELLAGHEVNEFLVRGGRSGFNPNDFNLDSVARVVKARPRH